MMMMRTKSTQSCSAGCDIYEFDISGGRERLSVCNIIMAHVISSSLSYFPVREIRKGGRYAVLSSNNSYAANLTRKRRKTSMMSSVRWVVGNMGL